MKEPLIPRRTLLRGLGTAMALPMLEAMLPLSALAQSVAQQSKPLRLAYLFVPNGVHMPAWTPTAEGTNFELPATLAPLQNVRDSVMVLSGLTQHNAFDLGDGGGDHARSAAAWLTGCHPRKTSGADIKAGISADQLAARAMRGKTPFASLELGCERGAQAGNCDSGYSCAYSSTISWQSESTPVAKEVDPRAIFERLFGNGDAEASAASRHQRSKYGKSILDFVKDDVTRLHQKLGAHDQRKLDEYMTGIRDIEMRLTLVKQANSAQPNLDALRPNGVPDNYGEHIRLVGDMMVLAFQSDMTRVATFMFANEGSNRNFTKEVSISEGHHDLSHHGGDPAKQEKIQKINLFQAQQLAYIVEKMKAIKEGDGTLLDHSMIVYGGGISDGNRHNHDELPIVVVGKGNGTLKTGRHIRYAENTPLNNLHLSLLDRMGVRAENLGDSTGRLQQLF